MNKPIIFIFLVLHATIYSMEQKLSLLSLPETAKQKIASYLLTHKRETDSDFIERTHDIHQKNWKKSIELSKDQKIELAKFLKIDPNKLHRDTTYYLPKDFQKYLKDSAPKKNNNSTKDLPVFPPIETCSISMSQNYGVFVDNKKIYLLDLENKQKKSVDNYTLLKNFNECTMQYIHETEDEEEMMNFFEDHHYVHNIYFNKQETKIIVVYYYYFPENCQKNDKLGYFELINIPESQEPTPSLGNYLYENIICCSELEKEIVKNFQTHALVAQVLKAQTLQDRTLTINGATMKIIENYHGAEKH